MPFPAANLRRRRSHPQTDTSSAALNFASIQQQVGPFFVQLATAYSTIEPAITTIISLIQQIWTFLQPYHPEDLVVALYGFFLVFFGGVFMTLVACAEAAHQFGWPRIRAACSALYHEAHNARLAFERDNNVDSDRNGIADVEEFDATNLMAHRLMVLSKSIDPENVATALEGLTMATVAILATLRIRFAKAITLGTAIGGVLHSVFSQFTQQILEYSLPDDYEKWIPVINKYGFRYLGVCASWILMRAVTSVFAAMRGSSLFLTGLTAYLVRHGHVTSGTFQAGNPMMVAAWTVLAVLGVYSQISSRFSLPFPLNLLLLPLTIAEQVVVFAVGSSA